MKSETKVATFAGGCFWGTEEAFRTLPGVVSTRVGYTGGHTENPTYEEVCTDTTGHAEAVEVTYDPQKVSYEELLEKFWEIHDPTQVNKQGPDVGSQYRSAIFYETEDERDRAVASKEALDVSGKYEKPVATEVVKRGVFTDAEEYHQQYIAKGGKGVCAI